MAALRTLVVAAMCLGTASAFMAPAALKLGSPSAVSARCALAPALRTVRKHTVSRRVQMKIEGALRIPQQKS